MTLTHIIPSLRRTMPDPMDRDRWPEFTTTSVDDVTTAGVSMVRLVDWCGSPAIHTAAAVIPFSGGKPSEDELVSIVVTRVIAVDRPDERTQDVWVDADLRDCRPVVGQARLIGRSSTAHDTLTRLHPADARFNEASLPHLPADVHPGDLIVFPCEGTVRLDQVDPNRHRPPIASATRDDQPGPLPFCGR